MARTPSARLHAIRKVNPPAGDGGEGRWHAIEVTVTPADAEAPWTPMEFAIVDEGVTETLAEVADARVWEGGGWTAIDPDGLVGEQRVRVLIALPAHAAGLVGVWHDGEVVAKADLARAERAAAGAEGPGKAGECAQCGALTMLSAAGLCTSCRGQAKCRTHGDRPSVTRCAACNAPQCAGCLQAGACSACEAPLARPTGRGGRVAATATAAIRRGVRTVVDQKKLLAGLVGVLVVIQGGLFAWRTFGDVPPPSTPEMVAQQRVGLASSVVSAYRQERKHAPKDAAEVAQLLAEEKIDGVVVVPPGGALKAGTVVYAPMPDGGYELYAVGEDGKPFGETKRWSPSPGKAPARK